MTQSKWRARAVAGLLLLGVLGTGAAAGRWTKRDQPRMQLMVLATDAIPAELDALELSDAQRERLRPIMQRGRNRVLSVVDDFYPRMSAAVDSTDADIRTILDDRQRAAFDSTRRVRPLLRRQIIRHAPTTPITP